MSNLAIENAKEDIAIIGMAGRFPGARNIHEFWQNLANGTESISFFSDEELTAAGIDLTTLNDPNYVKAAAMLADIERFDAAFFGFNPREAEIIDPQHRLFLECAWEALEDAGYNSESYTGRIGVYAGAGMNTYLLFNLYTNPQLVRTVGDFQTMIGNDKDFLPTRISYKLNLKGPSVSVQTACSTSLVAVCLGCQSLLSYQSDMVLAGGISIRVPNQAGYLYQPGGILSPDGHCRAFDAKAEGTVIGSGVGVVILKRLEDALKDQDYIYAVIKGSAVNNDGSLKVGYTAPSIEGQMEVIAEAWAMAEIEADTISYIETHGTGTTLGDPIEIAALTAVFQTYTKRKNFCPIGSVKTNVGHLDTAAGVTGLIKTVLSLKHKTLVPSLHFEEANPQLDLNNTPFYVNTRLCEWKTADTPRRAAVSSFGIGGTNAHVILQEAPTRKETPTVRPWQLLLLSAKTSNALETATTNLADYLQQQTDTNLADLAYTLQVGRKHFNYRRIAVCENNADAIRLLMGAEPQRIFTRYQERSERSVVFMFPGGGAQYVNMGLELYQTEAVFRKQVDHCLRLLDKQLGYDLRDVLFPTTAQLAIANEHIKRTAVALPALFVIEYALAKLWMSWGIVPEAMIGHSLGEYVAACLAGVFSLEDALSLVVFRGQLFEKLPPGGMLSIPLGEQEVYALVDGKLDIAALNGPQHCVVSGNINVIDEMSQLLSKQEIEYRRLPIDVAAHCRLVTTILNEFEEFVSRLTLHKPIIPFISNVTGTWITSELATTPNYWAKHLRQSVQFAKGIAELLTEPDRVLLEVGPGQTLTTLAKLQVDTNSGQTVISSMRHPYERISDAAYLLTSLGKLWLTGVTIDWSAFYSDEQRGRLPLPTYPFERQPYWVEPLKQRENYHSSNLGKKSDIADWFYLPSWKRSILPRIVETNLIDDNLNCWLLLVDECGLSHQLTSRLQEIGIDVVVAKTGSHFERLKDDLYTINPHHRKEYSALLRELDRLNKAPNVILHLWSITSAGLPTTGVEFFSQCQNIGYYSLLFLAQALGEEDSIGNTELWVISNHTQQVESADLIYPEKATMLAACKVIPQENEKINCHFVDMVVYPETEQARGLIDKLIAEITSRSSDALIVYRGNQRWLQSFEPIRLTSEITPIRPLRSAGVYLIIGGLGGIGLLLAEYLADTVQAKLVLLGRTSFPPKDQWNDWLSTHKDDDLVSKKIRRVQALEQAGAEVLIVNTAVENTNQLQDAIRRTTERFGEIHGVIHAAGMAGEKTINLIPNVVPDQCELLFQAKVYGLYTLEKVLENRELDFCLLFSSNAAILGGLGSIGYTAASLFMDAFATARNCSNRSWMSVNWDGWLIEENDRLNTSYQTSLDQYAMTRQESSEAFRRVVSMFDVNQIVVSTGALINRLDLWINRQGLFRERTANNTDMSLSLHPRPSLTTTYLPPTNELEQTIAAIWQELLGIEQVGIHDNFFELGGNSLIGVKVVAGLKKALSIDIPIVSLFEGPTVSALAKVISNTDSPKPTYEQSQNRGERRREKQQKLVQSVE
ncbi:MAG: beta-ketoacyl synthase N-terminal-like domain-containing protein [Acidobacteriota bacterium]